MIVVFRMNWLCICYLHIIADVIVLTKAESPQFSTTGKCYFNEGVKFTGTILKQTTANSKEDCCTQCQTMLAGERPCTAFRLDTLTLQCYLLSNVTAISEDPGYLSGHSARKLYKLTRQDEEPIGVAVVSSLEAKSEWHCGLACVRHAQCLSFSWMPQPPAAPSCTLLNVVEVDTTFQPKTGNRWFQIEYNSIANAIPIDCALSQWSDWTDCSENGNNCQNRTRSVIQPAVHGGSDAQCQQPLYEEKSQDSSSTSSSSTLPTTSTSISTRKSTSSTALTTPPPGETHILIFSGRSPSGPEQDIIDFNPETKVFTILNTQTQYKSTSRNIAVWGYNVIVDGGNTNASFELFEVFDSMPLVKLTNPVVPRFRYYGCGGVSNAKFYACFGKGDANVGTSCDVYDMINNYAHSTLNMQLYFGLSRMSCVFMDDYVYTVGGRNSGRLDYFYRFSLYDGSVTTLPNYPQTLENSAAVLYQGNIVVCGGYFYTRQCHLYNFTSAQWLSFSNLPLPVVSLSCVNWGLDRILCMGGHMDLLGSSDKVVLYENGVWNEYATMPYAMLGHTAVSVAG